MDKACRRFRLRIDSIVDTDRIASERFVFGIVEIDDRDRMNRTRLDARGRFAPLLVAPNTYCTFRRVPFSY